MNMPAWIGDKLGVAVPNLWSPDISYFAGAYHLYYAGFFVRVEHVSDRPGH